MTEQWSYWRVLRTGRVGPLLLGDLVSNVGDGMLLSALPQHRLLVGIIAAWAVVVVLLLLAPNVPLAAAAFFVGGLVYTPFTPVVYTYVQSVPAADEQQPVLTLWSAGSVLAAPVGLALAGPLVDATGPRGGLAVSAALTLVLALVAGTSGTRRRPTTRPG